MARSKTLISLMALLAGGIGLAGCNKEEQKNAEQKAQDTAQKAGDAISAGAEKAKDAAKEAADKATPVVKEAADKATPLVTEAAEKTKEATTRAIEKAKEVGGEAEQKAKDLLNSNKLSRPCVYKPRTLLNRTIAAFQRRAC